MIRLGVQCAAEEGIGSGRGARERLQGQPRSWAPQVGRRTRGQRRMQPGVLLRRPGVEAKRRDLSHAIRMHFVGDLKDLQYLDATSVPLVFE